MLRARSVSQRIAFRPWTARQLIWRRSVSDWNDSSGDSRGIPARTPGQRREKKIHTGGSRERDSAWSKSDARSGIVQKGREEEGIAREEERRTPSLVEQLFPEETKRYEAAQRKFREVPRLPLDTLKPALPKPEEPTRLWRATQPGSTVKTAGRGNTAVLALRNATPNLTEEDFRRLIPQGTHIEGWTLEQGDIIKVIPGRNLKDLSRQNVHYLLFSSPLSAFSYQSHVTRIHNLASQHTPSSITSPIPPPPGYTIEGLDVHAAIEAYALVPPGQKLELPALKPPLNVAVQELVKYQGYPSLVLRDDKMPYEARVTLDGPHLSLSAVRHEILESGKKRGLSWSGGENHTIQISRWSGERWRPPLDESGSARSKVADRNSEEGERARNKANLPKEDDPGVPKQKRRAPADVYIVGFHTERAAQSFVQYWHRRPIGSPKHHDIEGDIPPIANVELLW